MKAQIIITAIKMCDRTDHIQLRHPIFNINRDIERSLLTKKKKTNKQTKTQKTLDTQTYHLRILETRGIQLTQYTDRHINSFNTSISLTHQYL